MPRLPVNVTLPHKLVWSAHDYPFQHSLPLSYEGLADGLDKCFGFLLQPGNLWGCEW